MKITLDNLAAAVDFMERHRADKMSFKTAYKFNKIANYHKDDILFFREKYGELLREYCEKNEKGEPVVNGQNVQIQPDKMAEFSKKAAEILSVEVEASDVRFSVEELEGLEISMDELRPLMSFIEEA